MRKSRMGWEGCLFGASWTNSLATEVELAQLLGGGAKGAILLSAAFITGVCGTLLCT